MTVAKCPAGVIGLFGASNLRIPRNWVDFTQKQCRSLLKQSFAVEGKGTCAPDTLGSNLRIATSSRAWEGYASPFSQKALLDELGFLERGAWGIGTQTSSQLFGPDAVVLVFKGGAGGCGLLGWKARLCSRFAPSNLFMFKSSPWRCLSISLLGGCDAFGLFDGET